MKVSDNPIIQEWYDVYTKYLEYFNPDAPAEVIQLQWSKQTNLLLEYYENTKSLWKDDPIGFLKCYIDYYSRQVEHLEYIGHKGQTIPPNSGGRYWR